MSKTERIPNDGSISSMLAQRDELAIVIQDSQHDKKKLESKIIQKVFESGSYQYLAVNWTRLNRNHK